MAIFVCGIFFISGASALIFETLWFRQAGLALGNSVWASSLVLSGFMGGLAMGNALAARYGNRFGNPVRAYAVVEGAIALSGVGIVYLFPVFGAALAPWFRPLLEYSWILNPLRLLIAFALLLTPSTAMGVTLPLLTKVLAAYDPSFGRVLGRLYGWNTLGAVIGVVVGETYLIGALGVHGTAVMAGALNIAAAAAAVWLSTRALRPVPSPEGAGRGEPYWTAGWYWLIAACLSGFCLLALEVVWFRFLLLFVMGHSAAFSLMLGVVLAGIALGGLAASRWLRHSPDAHRFAAPIAFAAGLLCVGSYAAFPLIMMPFATSPYAISKTLDIIHVGLPLMIPVSFLSGIFFTLVGAALRHHLASETATTGVLTLANTIGAALGSLVGGFIFLPVLGMEKSFFLIAILYGGLGALLLVKGRAPRRMAYATAAVFLLSVVLFPFGSMEKRLLQVPVKRYLRQNTESRIAGVREGLTETIIYFETLVFGKPAYYTMLTNSVSMSGTKDASRRYMKLYVYWPMAVHPNLKRALLICYGVGNTAKAMTDSKSLETIDVVDISRDVVEMNNLVYPNPADRPVQDPRVRVHIEDGRYFLQTTERRFDLITAEPPPPGIAGVENLYTREYFQLLHDRLADGGIVTYWLPLHSLSDVSTKAILRAFCDVFGDCSLWNGMGTSLMMVGTRNANGPVSEDQFRRQWSDPVVAREMKAVGFERPEQLGALFIGDAEYLKGIIADSPPLVDNYPKLIEAPLGSQEEVARLFQSFTDVAAAKERFRRSPLIKRLWPEPLLNASLPYFEFQDIINAHWYGTMQKQHPGILDAHHLLTRSHLITPVLWRLGSDRDVQRIVADAEPAERAEPAMQFQLGIGLISERDYAAAVEPLTQAEQLPPLREAAFRLRIYALCMSGQIDQAQRLTQERFAQLLTTAKDIPVKSAEEIPLPSFWMWMKQTFGIDPRTGAPIPRASTGETLRPAP
ncbi:MAG TPA: spermidine synthase [Nitrospiria bacterium]|nr:spermidine synthase [Nitrospiria bacterium]